MRTRSILKRNTKIISAGFEGGECVLFNTEDRRAYLLNHTASEVYELTDGKRNIGEVAGIIADLYPVEDRPGDGGLLKDLKRIYRNFLRKGIIQYG